MQEMSKTQVIGITGSMGSGKSQVSRLLKKRFPILDCDRVNAKLLEKEQAGWLELKKLAWDIFDENDEINKPALAALMFSDRKKKETVETILHPLIFEKMHQWIDEQTSSLVFVEVPLLFEISAQDHFDEVWCIVCSEKTALYRLENYRHISPSLAKERLAAQMDVKEKIRLSDRVFNNDGTIKQLQEQLELVIKEKEQ